MADQNEIRTQLIRYVSDNDYLTHIAIADLIGTNRPTLESFLYGTVKNSVVAFAATKFLNGTGKQLAQIKAALQTNAGNRIALHQKRQQIFKQ
jgi:hypothetical protein